MKKKIGDYVAEWMQEMSGPNGYELSRCEFVKEAGTRYLRVYVDKLSGGKYVSMGSDDCEIISRFLSEKLDKEDPIKENYYLEISSPGLDRPLITDRDFERFKGEMIELKLYKAMGGQKEFTGRLLGKDGDTLRIECGGKEIELRTADAAKINLAVII